MATAKTVTLPEDMFYPSKFLERWFVRDTFGKSIGIGPFFTEERAWDEIHTLRKLAYDQQEKEEALQSQFVDLSGVPISISPLRQFVVWDASTGTWYIHNKMGSTGVDFKTYDGALAACNAFNKKNEGRMNDEENLKALPAPMAMVSGSKADPTLPRTAYALRDMSGKHVAYYTSQAEFIEALKVMLNENPSNSDIMVSRVKVQVV